MLRAVISRPSVFRISAASTSGRSWYSTAHPSSTGDPTLSGAARQDVSTSEPSSPQSTVADTDASPRPPPPDPGSPPADHTSPEDRVAHAREQLRYWTERNAIVVRQRTDELVASLGTSFSQLGGRINKVTGYEEIEALKRRVVDQEARIAAARTAARDAKTAYEEAMQQRSNSQREVNDLLQRKSTWNDADVGRFTVLVRQDHLYEQEEARAKAEVGATEDEVEREFSELMRAILARYHEEQVWSDKIRSVSSYGQLAVLGVNVFVFVLAIVLVEPWKRKRLAQTFERKVEELERANGELVRESISALEGRLEARDRMLESLVLAAEVTRSPSHTGQVVVDEPPETVDEKAGPAIERLVSVSKQRDVAAVLASGTFVAGALGWLARGWFGS